MRSAKVNYSDVASFEITFQGGLNLGCDALAVEGCYGGCHPLPSLPDLYSATAEESSDDGPSICPMAIEEPASSVGDARSSDDILGGILDSNGGSAAGDCRWCALVRGCGDVEKGRGEKIRSTPRSPQTVCQESRLPLFGVVVTFLILVVVAVVIYCSAGERHLKTRISNDCLIRILKNLLLIIKVRFY